MPKDSSHYPLYHALGLLILAVALADGEVQEEERKQLEKLVDESLEHDDARYVTAQIAFALGKDTKLSQEQLYNSAIGYLTDHKALFNANLKVRFATVLTQIAAAFAGIDDEEAQLIARYKADVATL